MPKLHRKKIICVRKIVRVFGRGICAEVMYCSVRSLVAFVSRSIGSTNSFDCFWLYLNNVYQYEHVLLSTIYIRAFGGYIMAIWPVAFIEICSSDPTFLCS